MTPAAIIVHRRSGPAAPRPSPQLWDAPSAGPDELWLNKASLRVLEEIPNSHDRVREPSCLGAAAAITACVDDHQ